MGNNGHTGHYLEIDSFPSNAAEGRGAYNIGNDVCVNFGFTRTQSTLSGSPFDAWYVNAPDSRFVLTPLREGPGDNISELCMTFADVPKFLARFGIDQTEQDTKKVEFADPLPAKLRRRRMGARVILKLSAVRRFALPREK